MRFVTRSLLAALNAAGLAYLVATAVALNGASAVRAGAAGRGAVAEVAGIGGFGGGFSGGFNIGAAGGFNGVNGFNFGSAGFGGFGAGNFGGGLGAAGLGGIGFGGFVVTTDHVTVVPGERIDVSFGWAVPAPGTWHDLETMQLRFLDGARTLAWTRWDEATNAIRLVNPKTRKPRRGGKPGSRHVLATARVHVHLKQTSVVDSGPGGTDVIVNFAVSFTRKALGRTVRVEALASNDAGERHGFEQVGEIQVARP
jgi:hypothetical protein